MEEFTRPSITRKGLGQKDPGKQARAKINDRKEKVARGTCRTKNVDKECRNRLL